MIGTSGGVGFLTGRRKPWIGTQLGAVTSVWSSPERSVYPHRALALALALAVALQAGPRDGTSRSGAVRRPPFADAWALAGRPLQPERRSALRWAGSCVEGRGGHLARLEQLGTGIDPYRNPHSRTVATAYLGLTSATLIPCSPRTPPGIRWTRCRGRRSSTAPSWPRRRSAWRPSCRGYERRLGAVPDILDRRASIGLRGRHEVTATNPQRAPLRRGVLVSTGEVASPGPFTKAGPGVTHPFAVLRPPPPRGR